MTVKWMGNVGKAVAKLLYDCERVSIVLLQDDNG
jgi:hypothetical protein